MSCAQAASDAGGGGGSHGGTGMKKTALDFDLAGPQHWAPCHGRHNTLDTMKNDSSSTDVDQMLC